MKYDELLILKNIKSVCLISHISPDADALGSMVTIKAFLKSLFNVEQVDMFAEAPKIHHSYTKILIGNVLNPTPIESYEACIVLDCPNSERLGKYKQMFMDSPIKIVIDHHNTNLYEGQINIVENVSSTCEIVYRILKSFNYEFTLKDKNDIYSGIITDTNNFSVGNFTKSTFDVVGEIVDDINAKNIYLNHFSNNSLKNMQMFGVALQNLKAYENNRIIISHISNEEALKFDATYEDFMGIINRLATITGSKMICLIQPKNEEYYVSLRSSQEYDVSPIATKYGGGGHRCACAFNSDKTIEELENLILQEFKSALQSE